MGYDMQWQKNGEREGYFRSNIWGMGPLRAAMLLAGAISDETGHPRFPAWPFGDEDVPEGDPRRAKYDQDLAAARATPGRDGKVPMFKFCSNDGWIVTPAESKLIAEKLTAWLAARSRGAPSSPGIAGTAFIQEFADYNRKCAEAETSYEVW